MKSRALLALLLFFAPLALGQMWEATRIGQQNVELLTDTGAHISWHQNVEEATEKGQKWSLEHELRTFITKPAGTRWDATAFAQTYPGENDSQPEGAGAPNGPPVWNNTPSPSFSTPISSSDSLLQYVSDPEGDALTFVNETGCTLLAVTTQNYSLLTAPTCGGVVAP